MKHFLQFIFVIAILTGCDILFTDNNFIDDKNNEEALPCKLYHITDDITPFESVFLAEDGNCLAIKKDTTFGYVAVIDSLKADDEKALVVYLDSLGKVRRLFNDGKSLDITHNDERHLNLWYRDTDGTSEVFDLILNTPQDTTILAITKAGEVFDPMDIASIAFALLDLKDIGKAVAFNSHIADGLKANILADLLTVGPFSNTATEVLTGITSVAITAAIGAGGLPLTALLATIGIANAAISDWQNIVADNCFGSAIPITGDAVQVTDKHIVIHYSLSNVVPSKTDFLVGVIVADGLFITKNHHLLKESVAYESQSGYITINIEELHKVKGDRLKYRVYLEPINDNGFKWDDELLDYWRYGEVKEFEIAEPELTITSVRQTNAIDNNGHNYLFEVEITASNSIPFEENFLWGVNVYESFSEICESTDDVIMSKEIYTSGNVCEKFSLNIDINGVYMHTDNNPYTPIANFFAVPYVCFDGYLYELFTKAHKLSLSYEVPEPKCLTGDPLEINPDSATITCTFENVPNNGECQVILYWADGYRTIKCRRNANGEQMVHIYDLEPGIIYYYQACIDCKDGPVYGEKKELITICPTSGQWIDLGLPSGNLWAAWNVGANSPEEFGGYYAWGETEEKNTYSSDTYVHREWNSQDMRWYVMDIGSDIGGTSYDVAHIKLGSGAKIPNEEEMEELLYNCEWVTGIYKDVKGQYIIGPNKNNIFLPFAGRKYTDDAPYSIGDAGGFYWLSITMNGYGFGGHGALHITEDSSYTNCSFVVTGNIGFVYWYYFHGFTVRALKKDN